MSHRGRMTDHIDMNRRNWDERAAIHARDTTGDYMVDRFRAGEDALHAIEASELGDISGKRVLHLQCHIGLDTLCLVRRGAIATGLDFSSAALKVARRLSEETGLKADFVEGDRKSTRLNSSHQIISYAVFCLKKKKKQKKTIAD